ncbi:hypothetical protein Lser_V15G06305 [Lactuca serriola]
MEFVSAIIGPIVESLIAPVKKQLGYLFSSTKHVRNMNAKIKLLDDTSRDVKNHMETNDRSNLEIPAHVPGWLEKVEKTKEKAQRLNIPSTRNGCFNMKMRYRAGRNAFKITEEMESLIDENIRIMWTNAQKPLGKVKSNNASTSTPSVGDAQNHFKSREKSFKDALEFLQQDHMSKVIALCGMGGVGKTIMMEQVKKTVEDKKMFNWIVKVVIGQKTNMLSIQQAVAEYMGLSLTEMSVAARADRLRITFGKMSERKEKILVILDDVWETIELKDIGLSPLPNSFKLLLTSRYENICKQIAVEADPDLKIIKVDVVEEPEAQNFFWQITGALKQQDKELNKIGTKIVRRCGFLPLAINLIASRLKFEEKGAWRDTLRRLENKNLDYVQESIKISYDYIKEEEEKAIFLLCGLFPDDFNIPIEELTRYAWGLRLLNGVSTLREARDGTETHVHSLKKANLLMDGDYIGCVKMHDLVLDFVLSRVSKSDRPWVINHGDNSMWSSDGMSEICNRISITCTGIFEFPRDFIYPNLSLLRLMDGDKSLKFPEGFYERMENLEVIAYEKMQYPLLPRSLKCSTKLRTLVFHRCSLMFDWSAIGELLNLEVLSFAHCGITNLPSAIGKLKQLKLLDLTGCTNLRIDDGVLRKLVKLEELYMRVDDKKAIRFTNSNHAELAKLSEHLSALEVEFFDNSGKPMNVLFMKLERFRISMGCALGDYTGFKKHSFENTLMLVTSKDELLESRMNELFEQTQVLYLEVDGMKDLEEVLVEPKCVPQHLFNNLKVLDVFKCANLKCLFTVPMVSGLMKLERLTVSECPVLDVLAYGGDGVIKFQELKFLKLDRLPKLVGLCNTVNVIELPELVELILDGLPNFTSIYPGNTSATSSISSNVSENQPLFNKEMLIPKLEILKICSMDKLKEIWPYQFSSSDKLNACMLREIKVGDCDNLVNLFPTNPMSLLGRLEDLGVLGCKSIEVLFNIDMSCVGEIEEYSSNLRHIEVYGLGKLRELWRIKGENSSDILIRSFQSVEWIQINWCERFVNVFTPTLTNYHVRTLMTVSIDGRRPCEEIKTNIQSLQKSQEINVISSIHPKPFLNFLQVTDSKDVEVVFEIESSSSNTDFTTTPHKNNHQPPLLLLPYLKELRLIDMERMSDVWKCNWKKLVIPQNQSQSYSFHNLTNIHLMSCNSIKYLFSPLMGKLLPNLKKVEIYRCDGIEEVVSNRDINDENKEIISTHTNTISSFPLLERLELWNLPCLKSINGVTTITTTSIHDQFKCSQVGVASWFLSQYSKEIIILDCHALSRVFPSYAVDLFDSERVNNDGVDSTTNVGDGSDDTCSTEITIPRSANMTLLQLANLTMLKIKKCDVLEYIFTSSTLESLKHLKELTVEECKAMKVIVKEDGEHRETSKSIIVFPRLKSLTLGGLPNIKGFFLGMNEFRWPVLEKVKIYGCLQMMTFTSGHSKAPKLNYIHTILGKHSLECGLNFHLTNATHEHTQLPMCSTPDMIKLLQFPWSFSNLIEVDAYEYVDKLLKSSIIFPCKELLNLKNLEKVYIIKPKYLESTIEEVFEVVDETNEYVVVPKLKEVALDGLEKLKHMWKSNRWIVLNFPNLTKVSVSKCPLLGHVFSGCMVGSLLKLQVLKISDCESMDVIVKQVEDSKTRPTTEVVFPCLKSMTLEKLPNLKGFCLGKGDFLWPSLDALEIKNCPEIAVFTNGQSTTPDLKLIDTTFGLCHVMEDPNSFIKTKQQEDGSFRETTNSHMQFDAFLKLAINYR